MPSKPLLTSARHCKSILTTLCPARTLRKWRKPAFYGREKTDMTVTPHLDPLPSSDEGRGNTAASLDCRVVGATGCAVGFLSPSEGERIKVRGWLGGASFA